VSIKVQGLLFSGPYDLQKTTVRQNHVAVVYLVVDKVGEAWDPKYDILDVGETGGRTVEFGSHPKLAAWRAASRGQVSLYFYSPEAGSGDAAASRARIVAEIGADLPGAGKS
jgi:hypothetical protein